MQTIAHTDIRSLEMAMREYSQYTEKTLPEIVNQRLLNVAGRAVNATPIADKVAITIQLGEIARGLGRTKKGKIKRGKRIFASSTKVSAPLAALIINARRRKSGQRGLYGSEMTRAIRRMTGGRYRSIGFERSGYIPGIRDLARTLKKPFIIGQIKGISVKGQPKGEAHPAPRNSFNPKAILINRAKGITKVGVKALEKAIGDEGRELARHIDDDLKPGIQKFNASK